MLFDGITLVEGTDINNLVIDSGSFFPDQPDAGELFLRTDVENAGLYVYVNSQWTKIITTEQFSALSSVATSGSYNDLTDKPQIAGDVTLTGTQTLTNKTVSDGVYSNVVDVTGSIRTVVVVVPALDVNCSLGNFFTKTINSNSTFTFSNAPASKAYSFVLELTHTSGTVTWPASVRWPAGTAPTLTSGKTHLFVFVTDDGGTTWRGASSVGYTN